MIDRSAFLEHLQRLLKKRSAGVDDSTYCPFVSGSPIRALGQEIKSRQWYWHISYLAALL
jgi:Lhr-like helicase